MCFIFSNFEISILFIKKFYYNFSIWSPIKVVHKLGIGWQDWIWHRLDIIIGGFDSLLT